jgi:Leucine-rich repeat (LRR) protein
MGTTNSKIADDLPFGYIYEESELKKLDSELQQSEFVLEFLQQNGFTQERLYERYRKAADSKEIVFEDFQSLKSINSCSRRISEVSNNLGYLHTTTRLMLCCNQLAHIPPEIGYMKNLTLLTLSDNQLKSLPAEIGHLTKLKELMVNNNELKRLPSSIGLLSELRTFHVSNNKLEYLPSEMGMLKKLEDLDISRNPLTMIPEELSRASDLKVIESTECPFLTEIAPLTPSSVVSLKELAARTLVRHRINLTDRITPSIRSLLDSAHSCSFCGGNSNSSRSLFRVLRVKSASGVQKRKNHPF